MMTLKPYALALALTLSSTLSHSSFATTTEELDLSSMTDAASTIVTATVVSSKVDTSENRVRTMVTLQVTDKIKGNTQDFITVALPDGSYTSGRIRVGEVSAGTPKLFPNQDALLFLNGNAQSDAYTIVGHSQGYMAIRDVDGGRVLQSSVTGGKEVSVSSMRSRIAAEEAQ